MNGRKKITITLRKGGIRVVFSFGAISVHRSRWMNGDNKNFGDLDSMIRIAHDDAEHDIQDLKAEGYIVEQEAKND